MATIIDIARETGYSLMTVSRAFNSPQRLKPETLRIILEKAAEMQYHPNNVARSLALKRTNIIYVYIPKELAATEPFVTQTVAAIGERLGESGYSFLLSRRLPHGVSYDGVIMMGLNKEDENVFASRGIEKPWVLYGNRDSVSAWVDVDNYAGEREAVTYLYNKGRRRIACIGAPQYMHYAEERLDAYKAYLAEQGLISAGIEIAEPNEHEGYKATIKLLASSEMDAIVCATDSIAIGCIRALKEKNILIPDDIAVVGFDGFGYEKVVSPSLTTVKQPLYEVGIKLADSLLTLLDGGESQRVKVLPSLVINQSA